jgi:hypothetical protein
VLRVIVSILTFETIFSHMALHVKQVWTFEECLHIIEEVEKIASEKED